MLLPHFQVPRIRRLVQRPVASLPRTPSFFVKFGPPMTAEDLTHDAPSVLIESRKMIDDVLERRQALQSAPDHIAPDTPFWRLPPKMLNKKAAKWKGDVWERATTADGDSGGVEEGSSGADHGDAQARAADELKGVVDLQPERRHWREDAVAPARCVSEVLKQPGEQEEAAVTKGAGSAASTLGRAQQGDGVRAAERRRGGAAEGLVAALRRKADEFARTGVDPDIRDSLAEALKHHPGTERAARLQEMHACAADFQQLVLEGKASVRNCNELIRAQALQGNMEAALRTHDAMQLHGYDPDDGTFVSLMLGAAQLKDAELARRLFLKMREQLISATPKVYSALIKAHVQAGDISSGFALMRKMEDEQLQPDVVVYTVLINGLVVAGHLAAAWEEFHSIRTWKLIQPDEVLFTVMIKACAQASEAERALNMLDDLRMSGLYPTDLTYGELIHAMATSPDHARKAFDFYRQMQAEDLPLSPFIFEKLLQACRNLGDPVRAQAVVRDMHENGVPMQPDMYCHLVGLLANAMRKPKVTEQEKVRHLRSAWHIVADARAHCPDLEWTKMLNEIMGVYIAGGYPNYAVDMLQHFPAFGVSPNAQTYQCLLELLGRDMKDVGRFFALWEVFPREPKPPEELYNLALEVALESRSSKQTCAVLEEMCSAAVFPTPQLTERLAKAGRHVIQIHGLVARLIALNKARVVDEAKRNTGWLQTHMDERELRLAASGLTVRSPTPEQEARAKFFEGLHKRGFFKRPWLPFGEYLASKRKGGEAYAKRHDKPRPNILAA